MWKKNKEKTVAGNATARSAVPLKAPAPSSAPATAGATNTGSALQIPALEAAAGVQHTATVRQADLVLGQIVSLLMRSPQHKHCSLADLEWLVLPAVLSGQFRIVQAQPAQGTAPAPVGVALWAMVSAEVDKKLSDLSIPARLRPDEWRSGDIPWLMELVCDTRVQQPLLKALAENVFKDHAFKMRVRGAGGKIQICTLGVEGEAKQV